MDYKKLLARLFFWHLISIFLLGCETELSKEPLELYFVPPSILYIDSPYEDELGASGGNGAYKMRYIQNPELDEDEEGDFEDNYIDMTIEDVSDTKPAFRLRTLPVLAADKWEELSAQKLRYQIELTDGSTTKISDYEVTVEKNTLSFFQENDDVNEGQDEITSFLKLNELRNSVAGICKQIEDFYPEVKIGDNGETLYPVTFSVRTDAIVSKRTEFHYVIRSNYDESVSERTARNISKARPGVDFLEASRVIVFEAGDINCGGYFYALNDAVIESSEDLEIEFTKSVGALIDISQATKTITLNDDEPTPNYITDRVTRNRGDNVVVPITLDQVLDKPLHINVTVDSDTTTANSSEFTLSPESGVVIIPAGQLQGSYTINLLEGSIDQQAEVTEDKLISVKTDIDVLLDNDPYIVSLNEWPLNKENSTNFIASSKDEQEVIDMSVNSLGQVFIALKNETNLLRATASIQRFSRDGTVSDFMETGAALIEKNSVNVIPKAIMANIEGKVVLVANVDGLFSDIHRGEKDFIVAIYSKEEAGTFSLESVSQFGTEGDDTVTYAVLRNEELYVYGSTNGLVFDGVPGFETNNGGLDGFVYKIAMTNTKVWSRFIGTVNDDVVSGLDASHQNVALLVSKELSDTNIDGYVHTLAVNSGLDKENPEDLEIASLKKENFTNLSYNLDKVSYSILADSDASILESDFTPTLTRDAQLLSFSASNEKQGNIEISTDEEDIAVDLEFLAKEDHAVVGGYTAGEFEGSNKKGIDNNDAFISVFDSQDGSTLALKKTLQFGTQGEDRVLNVVGVSEDKFLVLWSENHTSTLDAGNLDGEKYIRYRISAYSSEGEMLSPDSEFLTSQQ